MGLVCSLVVTAGLLVTASSPPVPAPVEPPRRALETYLFRTPLERFVAVADAPGHDARFDWNSDGCSAPVVGSDGRSFDFAAACRRHDFGYRNFLTLEGGRHWTAPVRRRVDDQFLRDMKEHCATRRRSEKLRCLAWAATFHRAVRIYAGP